MGTWRRLAVGLALAGAAAACSSQPPVAPRPSPTPTGAVAAGAAGPCATISISASKGPSITAGDLVILTARAGGCASPLYRFLLLDQAGATGAVTQDWGTSATWTWDSYTTQAGQYLVRTDARSSGSFAGTPEVSAYLAFTVIGGVPATVDTCRLPVSGPMTGSGGFISMPSGKFAADKSSDIPSVGQGDQSGLRLGLTYDPVHGKWLPVPRDWVMPDFSSYVYVGSEHPNGDNMPALHVVKLPGGADTIWPNGDQLYGYPIALRPEGVYGAPGPEIITLVGPSGARSTVDQGHLGLYAVITPPAIWATRDDTPGLNDVERVDVTAQAATEWFKASSGNALPIGVDGNGSPIVAVGKQLSNARISATLIVIATRPLASASALANPVLYSDPAHPLTIVGWPIVSAGGIWIETDKGLWLFDGHSPTMRLVSTFTGYIAGGCV